MAKSSKVDALMKTLSLDEVAGGAIKDTNASFDRDSCKIVIYDLEATGLLPRTAEICQIGAYCENYPEFCVYTIPSRRIPDERISTIPQLVAGGGKMFLKEQIAAVSILEGLKRFLGFLKKVGNVILVAHNNFRYDAPLILQQMKKYELDGQFRNYVKGFADTLPIFKTGLPYRLRSKEKFNQVHLARAFLHPDDIRPAHDASNDVYVLHKLIEKLSVTKDIIKSEAISLDGLVNHLEILDRTNYNKKSLECLGDAIESSNIRKKLADNGINFEQLKLAFDEYNADGVKLLLRDLIIHDRDNKLKLITDQLESMKADIK